MASLRRGVATLLAAGALTGATVIGTAGTAVASPAAPAVAPVASDSVVLAPDRPCRKFWHNGSWAWQDRGSWDRGHHWHPHRVRYWHQRWYGC